MRSPTVLGWGPADSPARPAAARRRHISPAPILAFVIAIAGALVVPIAASQAATTTTTYAASSATIANPERGFFRQHTQCEQQPFVPSNVTSDRRGVRKASLMRCVFYLPTDRSLSQSSVPWPPGGPAREGLLTVLEDQAQRIRAGGSKLILRFAYTTVEDQDATPDRVQGHLDELAPVLRRNSDVIAVMESGFVGRYGEGHGSRWFGDPNALTATNLADRKAVVTRLLTILPAGRKVLVRTPLAKQQMFGGPATPADVTANRAVARVGHVNDCFLATDHDQGTYRHDEDGVDQVHKDEYAYLKTDTALVPMGGESCALNPPRSDCPTALRELGMFHYSYMHWDYKEAVRERWASGGCLEPTDPSKPSIHRQLGYRFVLTSVTSNTTVVRGERLPFSMTIRNRGWSAPINSRPVRLVLRARPPLAPATRRFHLTDARSWGGQTTQTSTHQVPIPTRMPPGSYDVLLSFPDPAKSLATNAAYAIQLANTDTLDTFGDPDGWDTSTGLNRLGRVVTLR